MTLDDEQLDELLRDVSVPSDLKASLLAIPDQANGPVQAQSFTKASKWKPALLALAASLLVFLAVYSFPASDVDNTVATTEEATKIEGSGELAEALLAQMESNLESIEMICAAQDRIDELDAAEVPKLSLNESLSIAMAVSWQSSLDRGASFKAVKSELEYIVSTYPNTRGAQLAENILEQNL